MDRPDICFLSYGLYSYLQPGTSKDAGGAERQQYLIARELVERGYDVSAIVGDYGQEKHEVIDGIDVWRAYRSVGKSGFKSPKGMIRLPLQIGRLINTIFDVNAKRYYTRSTLFYPILYLCSRLKGFQYYCGLSHDRDVEESSIESSNFLFKRIYLASLDESDQVISQTKYQRNTLYKNYEIESTIIKNGYEIPEYKEQDSKHVLWVGRADRDSKNPESFLELAKRISNLKFVMIVAPGQNDEYYRTLKQRGQKIDNVDFEGFVEPNQIQSYYREAIALVNTSSGEGFPNTFLEAWAVGTPVISLNVDLDGLIEDSQIGRYSASFEQLVRDVKELSEDETLNLEMGRRGREYVVSNHSIRNIVDEFERVVL